MLPIIIKLIFEKNILNLDISNWLEWGSFIKLILICILPIPLIFPIRLLFSADIFILISFALIYFSTVFLLEIIFDVFMFKKELIPLNSMIKSKLGL